MNRHAHEIDIRCSATGTPRTYGSLRNDAIWCEAVTRGRWSGLDGLALPLEIPLRVDFHFRIHAASEAYGWNPSPNGRDLDTMVLQDSTLGALTVSRSQRPSLRMIAAPALCRLVTATKSLVGSDAEAGVDIRIRTLGAPGAAFGPLPMPELEVRVPAGALTSVGALAPAVERAAATANAARQLTFNDTDRIGLAVRFAAGERRNMLSASYLEATVDALGNSPVAGRRLFPDDRHNPNSGRRNTDDTIVFALVFQNGPASAAARFVELDLYSSDTELAGISGFSAFGR